jgi:hypothetical protein
MLSKGLVTFMHDRAGIGIRDSLVVPVLYTINNSVEPHPPTGVAMEIITDHLLHEWPNFSCVAPLGCELGSGFHR